MIAGVALALAFVRSIVAVDPVDASAIAARVVGEPALAIEVASICKIESRCSLVGVHTKHADRVRGEVFLEAAIKRSWIDPIGCAWHRDREPDQWGVRGPHGNVAAYAVRHLGACVAPEVLDLPIMSAIATARRLVELRRRYGRRTPAARDHAWRHGVGCSCGRAK